MQRMDGEKGLRAAWDTCKALQPTEKDSGTAILKDQSGCGLRALHLLFCSRTELDHVHRGYKEATKQFGAQSIQSSSFVPLEKYATLAISTYIIK